MTAVSDILSDAPDLPTKATIEDEILASDPDASTSTKLRLRAQRLLVQHAPVVADQAAAQRRRDYTDVTVAPHLEPGMSTLTAVMPALDAAHMMAAINTHARLLLSKPATGTADSPAAPDPRSSPTSITWFVSPKLSPR